MVQDGAKTGVIAPPVVCLFWCKCNPLYRGCIAPCTTPAFYLIRTIKENYTITRTSTHTPGAEKICVTKTQASAARSASGGRAAGCEKNLKATAFVSLGRVTLLALLTHKTYRDFRYGFMVEWQLRDATRQFRFKANLEGGTFSRSRPIFFVGGFIIAGKRRRGVTENQRIKLIL